ncbi:spore germination protein [Paenibacillus sp. GD4]|uniref:spore germination protein n=1 Tax=Paenibacillus TaxID=44249 RepID=UPI002543574F|nr:MULTISPECIES: spore germination protein [Paenibacillus]MDQ1914426.1 spore germination protein [Paenibacillus sp. GD4]
MNQAGTAAYNIESFDKALRKAVHQNPNLIAKQVSFGFRKGCIFYLNTIVDQDLLQRDVIGTLIHLDHEPTTDDFKEQFPVGAVKQGTTLSALVDDLFQGWVYLYLGDRPGLLFYLYKPKERTPGKPDVESQVLGPQVGFTEILNSNIALLQTYLPNPDLCQEMLQVGTRTKTQVALLYVKQVADDHLVEQLRTRIEELSFDGIVDSAVLVQLIDDNKASIFPQMILTERIDRVTFSLLEGKLVLLVSGSPFAIVCPATMMDFFSSAEDHLVRWNMGTFTRFLRVFAMVLSLLFTPVYVAALTFHYEIVPTAMVVPLAESRTRVPFPPLLEALFLESTIELLREAGARLPTKVGQTIGIVGGIVIGQAAVQAGFTSNILIIIVALGALSSFVTPVYLMGITIRIIRFPLIILAGLFGGLGIMIGVCFLLIHLLRLTSLGQPYLYPLVPFRWTDQMDSLLRFPFSFLRKRSPYTHGEDQHRWKSAKDKDKNNQDIDE